MGGAQIKRLGAMWSVLEPYASAYGRVHLEDADGLRVHQVSDLSQHLIEIYCLWLPAQGLGRV